MASTQELENIYQPHSPGPASRRRHLIREMVGAGRKSASGSDSGSFQLESSRRADRGWETDSDILPTFRTAEPDFQINTSALKRAFPDFSQTGSSEGEPSIEVGRGYNRNNQLPSEDVSEALPFSIGGTNYRLMGTPPMKPRKNIVSIKGNVNSIEDKENEAPVKESKTGSGSKSSNDSRRTLVDRRPTVETDHDDSVVINQAKATEATKSARTTRFGNNRMSNLGPLQQQPHHPSTPQNGTAQSFLLPDIPNITELMQSARPDGTPPPHSVKSRAKANTPSLLRRVSNAAPAHSNIPDVPVPAEVKALYISLQLLQEKVDALEADKERTEKKGAEQELELLQVKSKLEAYEHEKDRDSGLGDDLPDQNVEAEKTKLEMSLQDLQHRLEKAQKKITRSEDKVSALRKEREMLNQRSARADRDNQTFTGQNLVEQVYDLRTQLAELNREHQKQIQSLSRQETELRGKIERREKAINQMALLSKELYSTRAALAVSGDGETNNVRESAPESRRLHKSRRQVSQPNLPAVWESTTTARSRSATRRASAAQVKPRKSSMAAVDDDRVEQSDAESTTHIRFAREQEEQDLTMDSAFFSFMEGNEVSKLRRVVEEDKARLAAAQSSAYQPFEADGTAHSFVAPRRSSMKKVSYGGFTHRSVAEGEPTETTRNLAEQHTQRSNMSQTSERRRRNMSNADMTSAFLVEDINLEQLAPEGKLEITEGNQHKVKVPRPVPVSDRVLETDEIDPTVRPARSPGIALATVIKGLEDEIAELRGQLAVQEGLYQKHDPALSRRKRKIVFARIQKLMAAIEIRADQIYALYDVLEGQKAVGQMMNEEEIEVTLQNLGIDSGNRNMPLSTDAQLDTNSEMSADDSSDDDDDLPSWGGIDDTQTQRLEGLERLAR